MPQATKTYYVLGDALNQMYCLDVTGDLNIKVVIEAHSAGREIIDVVSKQQEALNKIKVNKEKSLPKFPFIAYTSTAGHTTDATVYTEEGSAFNPNDWDFLLKTKSNDFFKFNVIREASHSTGNVDLHMTPRVL